VNQIIRAGWVEEDGSIKTRRGRYPVMLRPSSSLLVYAVVRYGRKALLGLVNLQGNVVEQLSVILPFDHNAAAQFVADELQKLANSNPGRIMCAAGICMTARTCQNQNAEQEGEEDEATGAIAQQILTRLGVTVEIGSELHAAMLHEMGTRDLRKIHSAVLLHISDNVTGSIWVNSEFLNQDIIDIGHICVDPRGPVCHCGRYGCWSLYASDSVAMSAFRSASASRKLESIEELHQLSIDGDAAAIHALKIQGEGIVAGIHTLAKVLAPDLFIIQGACTGTWQGLATRTAEEIKNALGTRKMVNLVSRQIGDLNSLRAAAALGCLRLNVQTAFKADRDVRI
jgi:predicted NBD/HSP70 family sugar kinase